jgi:hypothetical protein
VPAAKRRPKLPVPLRERCTMTTSKGKQCERRRSYTVTREDRTRFDVCTTCAKNLRELHDAHPDLFRNLRFSALVKYTPVE